MCGGHASVYNYEMVKPLGPISWELMIRAVELVRERLLRATEALERQPSRMPSQVEMQLPFGSRESINRRSATLRIQIS